MLKRTARSEPHRARVAGGPGGPRGDRDFRKRGPGEDRSRKAISVPELALLSSVVDLAADPSPGKPEWTENDHCFVVRVQFCVPGGSRSTMRCGQEVW